MIETDLFARVSSGDRGSDTVMVHVRQPVFLASLEVTARYPAYLGLEDEPIPTAGDTVLLPAGHATGNAGRSHRRARERVVERWRGRELRCRSTGSSSTASSRRFARALIAWRCGRRAARRWLATPIVLPLRIVPDSAPALEIPVPGADTTASPDARALIVVDAHDDHGLKSVVLELRRVSGLGTADPMREQAVPLPGGTPDRAVLSAQVSLQQLGLLPGDTLHYRARAVDNSPRAQSGWSSEYVLRIQTLTELRAEQRRETSSLQSRLDSLSAASKKLERQTEDLARSQPRDATKPGDNSDNLSFEQAKKAEAVAQSQQELLKQAEQARQALQELQKNAETAGIADSALMARLAEVQQQLDKALTPEIRAKLEELRQALKELDAERTQEALKDLAETAEGAAGGTGTEPRAVRARRHGRTAGEPGAGLEGTAEGPGRMEQAGCDRRQPACRRGGAAAGEEGGAAVLGAQAALRADEGHPAGRQARPGRAAGREGCAEDAAGVEVGEVGPEAEGEERGGGGGEGARTAGRQPEEEREQMAQDWRDEVLQQLDQALADLSRLGEQQLAVSQGFERGEPAAKLRPTRARWKRESSGCRSRCARRPERMH